MTRESSPLLKAQSSAKHAHDPEAQQGRISRHTAVNYADDPNEMMLVRTITWATRVRQFRELLHLREHMADPDSDTMAPLICSVLRFFTLTLGLGISSSMVIAGLLYIDECPVEKYIPIYMIVAGTSVLLMFLLPMFCVKSDDSIASRWVLRAIVILSAFMTGWTIAGAFWVNTTQHIDTKDPVSPLYCNQTLFYVAKAVTGVWLYFGWLLFLILICI
ncbi:transmembrane protein 272-like [Ornithodoros turicata]|uniref:transmembrane protein 272-like n=1 Tax=Ornithodoros turicata TaxID=34597 RepID=UPI00313A14A9